MEPRTAALPVRPISAPMSRPPLIAATSVFRTIVRTPAERVSPLAIATAIVRWTCSGLAGLPLRFADAILVSFGPCICDQRFLRLGTEMQGHASPVRQGDAVTKRCGQLTSAFPRSFAPIAMLVRDRVGGRSRKLTRHGDPCPWSSRIFRPSHSLPTNGISDFLDRRHHEIPTLVVVSDRLQLDGGQERGRSPLPVRRFGACYHLPRRAPDRMVNLHPVW